MGSAEGGSTRLAAVAAVRRPSRSALATGALLVVASTVALAAAELLIRVTNGARYAERPVFYPKDDRLGWVPAAGLDHVYYGGDFSVAVTTDEDGARLGRLGAVAPGAPRVILLGDSYTFGWGVSTAETYASLLDERLAERDPPGPRIVNLGVGGYGTLQSAARLEAYLHDHPDAPVEGIVVLHSHNDPSDNVLYAAVRTGLREYREGRRNSGVHLHNLVRFVGEVLRGRGTTGAGTLPGGHRDFLYTVGAFPTERGKRAAAGDPDVGAAALDLMSAEQEVLPTYERERLTGLQLRLLRESIERVHAAARSRGAVVYHVAIHSAPDWYVEPIRSLVEADTTSDGAALWCGRVPALEEYDGPFYNDHSGSHFTPELNGYYARKLAPWLRHASCPAGEDET